MKTFDIITEADARVLPPGETVVLARGGHVTPLAKDTLAERRIKVIEDGAASSDDLALAPVADIRVVAVGSDHSGVTLRRALAADLRARGLKVIDVGTDESGPVDYPDIAVKVAQSISRGEADAGLLVDGTGIGSAIAANKVRGIRAAMATSEALAKYSREHTGANVLTLGASLVTVDEARRIVSTWLTTPMREPRYIRRLARIRDIERNG